LKIGIVSRTDKEKAYEVISSIVQYLQENDITIEIESRVCDKFTEFSEYTVDIDDMTSDIVLCIGGDGTVLYAQHHLSVKKIPILSINLGTVGFLTEVDLDDLFECLDKLLSYDFFVEERMQLDIECDDEWITVLNELVIMTSQPSKMLDLRVNVDDEVIAELRSDGLIVSTPSGSTAYAMSAGGPIVDPRVDAALIIPICPFKLNSRPKIVPSSSTITITFKEDGKPGVAVLDGVTNKQYGYGDQIRIRKSETPACFVRFSKKFYESVNKKLTMDGQKNE